MKRVTCGGGGRGGWRAARWARTRLLTGSIRTVPGSPGTPSEPGRPGRPGGPWRTKSAQDGVNRRKWVIFLSAESTSRYGVAGWPSVDLTWPRGTQQARTAILMLMRLQICFTNGVCCCQMKTMLVAKSAETPEQSFLLIAKLHFPVPTWFFSFFLAFYPQ